MKNRIAFSLKHLLGFLVAIVLMTGHAAAQNPDPNPSPGPSPSPQAEASSSPRDEEQEQIVGGYVLTSSIEVGVRGLKLDGNSDKYRSDLNYHPGARVFDSSFLLRSKDNNGTLFDSLLINSSGWGGDPSGYFRANVGKHGIYRLDMNYRRFKYFNSLSNIALGQHTRNTQHKFGDFDLTILPENQRLKFYFGFSLDQSSGPGLTTIRFSGDEFPVLTRVQTRANNFRAGVDAKVLGFNLSFLQGVRYFKDDSSYSISVPQPGNNTTNNSAVSTFQRELPTVGHHFFTRFSAHTNIREKLDFTGRFIYTSTATRFTLGEQLTGTDSAGNRVILDQFSASGDAKRPYGLGDLAATFFVTDKFKISESFRVDNFRISGGDAFSESLFRNRANGTPLPPAFRATTGFRATKYRRYMNTVEGDYEFNARYGVFAGYRYTNRHIEHDSRDQNLANPPTALEQDAFDNRTNAVLFGFRARPKLFWSIYFDGEHGTTDNVFVRVDNYKYTNFRVRTRVAPNPKFSFNASVITKDNNNPAFTEDNPPKNFGVEVKSRTFSGTVSYTPNARLSFDAGYTYSHLTSNTAIILFLANRNQRLTGQSQYFVRDHSVFVDVFVQIHPRVTAYSSYRINKDNGQGSLASTDPTLIITSYPFSFQSPEARLIIKLNSRVDWNVGYQYYNYKEQFPNAQNYRAHLPYTSLRIFFGRRG